ncbi:hypothetical protein HDU92_008337 [Lobulomyces angularis]|nr:hypothetical protein HDU92_008337 [Lobulomyces angularis]
MAKDLYIEYNVAKDLIDEAEEILDFNLKSIMFDGPLQLLTLTENTQPAILCHSIAVLRVLETEYGINVSDFNCALGHSLGEYTALVATKSLSFSDAVKLVRLRGKSMQESIVEGETCMRALVIDGDHLEDIANLINEIKNDLPEGEVAEIANINSRRQIVLSGTNTGVSYVNSIINTRGFAGRAVGLPVSAPFHCSLMRAAQLKMRPLLEKTNFNSPIIPVISNVTAKPYSKNPSEIRDLLCQQITKTVQWQKSVSDGVKNGIEDWVVCGPSQVLSNLLKREHPKGNILSISSYKDLELIKKLN